MNVSGRKHRRVIDNWLWSLLAPSYTAPSRYILDIPNLTIIIIIIIITMTIIIIIFHMSAARETQNGHKHVAE
jgi:heme/copper-type cytochrome/quinol oxidase subunit 2